MSSRYLISAEAIEPDVLDENALKLNSNHKYFIEYSAEDNSEVELYAIPEESEAFWAYLKMQVLKVLQPLKTTKGQQNFIIFAVIYTFSALVFFIKRILKSPLERGWRLEVVRLIASKAENPVPSISPDKLIGYWVRGVVLVVMRFIYFLPLFIIAALSGGKMFNLLKEIAFYIWDVFVGADQLSFTAFMLQKVIPQAGIEIIIQLVVLALYGVFVWPIYRLIMVQYALKLSSWSGFLSIKMVKKNIEIFKRNATLIYGVYGFSLAIDAVILIGAKVISIFSFGLLFFIIPVFHLVLRHWVKGYAYGYLGQKLLASNEIGVGAEDRKPKKEDLV